jgi:hypothetical protein
VNSPDVNLYEIKEDFSISITNDADEPQTINFEIDGDYSDIIIITETSKILAKNETRDIYFSLNDSDILQSLGESSTGTLTITSGEYKKNILLYYTQPVKEESSIPWLWIIIGVIIITISLFIVRRYNQLKSSQENSEEFQGEDDDLFLDEDIEFK